MGKCASLIYWTFAPFVLNSVQIAQFALCNLSVTEKVTHFFLSLRKMLSLLLLTAYSVGSKTGHVQEFDIQSWTESIEKRDPNSVWVLYVYRDNFQPSQVLFPTIFRASALADGLIHFGKINEATDAGILARLNCKIIPSIFIVHPHGFLEYKGKKHEKAIIAAASKFIPDKSIKFNSSFITDGVDTAIFFTDKKNVPSMWAGISCAFEGKARITKSSDQKLLEKLGGIKMPAMVMINKTHKIPYRGKSTFNTVRSALQEFFDGEYEIPFQFYNDYFLPEEFEQENDKFTGYSIVVMSDELPSQVRKARLRHNSSRFKYFLGSQNPPFPFMKPNSIWVVHNVREKINQITDPKELSQFLENVVEGAPNWKSFSDFQDL